MNETDNRQVMNDNNSVEALLEKLCRIEATLDLLVHQSAVKEWYSTDEVAAILGKRPFTVREWCRLGRIQAEKKECGRGPTSEWQIDHDELVRIKNHGLLPAKH